MIARIRNLIVSSAVSVILLIGTGAPAGAIRPSFCAPHDQLVARLRESFGEHRIARAVAGNTLLEVYANLESTTFTQIIIRGDGSACIIMAGDGWQIDAPKNGGEPA